MYRDAKYPNLILTYISPFILSIRKNNANSMAADAPALCVPTSSSAAALHIYASLCLTYQKGFARDLTD